ncbi:MAG: PaaI family thioesterase [Acidimicrobiales bacterium]
MSVPPAVMSALDLEEFLAAAFPLAPRTYRVEEVTDVGVLMRLPIGDEHERPGGTVSGPAMMTLADAAAWLATVSRIGPVALSVTSSLTINFLDKPAMADLWGSAELLKLGRRQSVTQVKLFSDVGGAPGDRLLAQASVTYAIPGDRRL